MIGNSDRSPYQRCADLGEEHCRHAVGLALRQGFIDSFATIDQAERAHE